MAIKLERDVEQRIISSIKHYVEENLDTEIGDLKAKLLLEYCLEEIAPSVYNKAIVDAQAYFQDKVVDLENACYEPEFGYWDK